MLYKATHTTSYSYNAAVSQCQSEVRLTPRTLPWQTLVELTIQTTPPPASVEIHQDYFGNEVRTFTILESHDRLSTVATSLVEVDPRDSPVVSDVAWERVRDELAGHSSFDTLEAFEFIFDSPMVTASPELSQYADVSFPPGRPLVAAIEDLSHRIHTEFRYTPKATRVDTPLLDVLRLRNGVCQDFAHVMIGAVRSMRLAARYVSGYLRSGAKVQGAEASHAWVSVFIPGVGWMDVDPTNDVRPAAGHITLGWGRDYGDVAPVKGVALGGGKQIVDVTVRVDPVDSPTSR
jgi:transglutaminase-like putative cysteine protease